MATQREEEVGRLLPYHTLAPDLKLSLQSAEFSHLQQLFQFILPLEHPDCF